MAETFYTRHFRFRTAPFHVTPDATLFFATDTHQQAMAAIEYGVAAAKGFIVVSGEVGVGKTTVLRAVLDRFDPGKVRVVYLFEPTLSVARLYNTILAELDESAPRELEASEALASVQKALLGYGKRGITVVLAVDEAQNMPEETLEHLRMLSNLETRNAKLLQIVLVGQPELDEKLRRRSLRQLEQRIAVRARIAPLSFRQSCRYILHRLAGAGRPLEPPLFTTPALWYVAWRAGGIPRSLNIYCDNALINGYGHHADRLTLRIVHEAVSSLRSGRRWPLVAGASAAVLALALIAYLHGRDTPPVPSAAPVSVPAQAARTSPPNPSTVAPNIPTTVPVADTAAPPPTSPPTSQGFPEPGASAAAGSGTPASPLAEAGSVSAAEAAMKPQVAAPATASSTAAAAIASSTAAPARTARPANRRPMHRWTVRPGDNLYRACASTYGECQTRELRAILALNPKIAARHGAVWPGEVLLLPEPGSIAH